MEKFKLTELPYERCEIKHVREVWEKIMDDFKSAGSGEEQFRVHNRYYELVKEFKTAIALANLRNDGNAADEFYEKERDYYDEIGPEISDLENRYKKLLLDSEYREYLEDKLGEIAFVDMEIDQKAFSESLIPLQKEENVLSSKYSRLISKAKIPFRGEELNLSLLDKYATSEDRNVRIDAVKARAEFFISIEDELDEIYDQLVSNRANQARLLGLENFVELGYYNMQRDSYDRADVKRFRDEVKKYLVPVASKIHEKRRQVLGLEELDYVDEGIYFLDGNPAPCGTPQDIFAAGKKMYSQLSEETQEFFDFMLEHELFDVLGRPGKSAGGYMEELLLYKAPIIFANFNGTSGDVDVMTHECGHAFHGFLCRNDEILEHNNIKSETAEVHSMSMEFFAEKWMELFFGERAEDYRKMHLAEAIAFVPYGCMIDEFQHIIYENPKMTPEERKTVWKKLEAEYKPHLKFKYDDFFAKGTAWQAKQHVYTSPFYYIDYCIAGMCALQFKMKMDEDFDGAFKKYLEFCRLSGKDYFPKMLEAAGLKNPFEAGTIKEICEYINTVI